MHVKT